MAGCVICVSQCLFTTSAALAEIRAQLSASLVIIIVVVVVVIRRFLRRRYRHHYHHHHYHHPRRRSGMRADLGVPVILSVYRPTWRCKNNWIEGRQLFVGLIVCPKGQRSRSYGLPLPCLAVSVICFVVLVMRKGGESSCSLAFRLYIESFSCAQIPGPVHTARLGRVCFYI